MALFSGKLFAGALFAGLLLGGEASQELPVLQPSVDGGAGISPEITHRAIRGKEVIQRTPAMIAAEAHLAKLQAEAISGTDNGDTSQPVDLGSLPASDLAVGNVAIRVPRYERPLAGGIPAALGTSFTASDAVPFALNEAMKRYAAQQAADEDDEMAIIAIMMELS